ncbi:MAG TPA: peptidoglycan DD-metalloendopeptidase family protein [Micromonosporaceae bacterium]|nr:peptidoglycan DD-metalloendopeptidase family protein [Micromonosporaceae bacterium]
MPHLVTLLLLLVLAAAPAAVPPGAAMAPAPGPAALVSGPAALVSGLAALALNPADPAQASRYRWPLDGVPAVARRFAPPPDPWLAGHRGVDLAAQPGQLVRAAGSGVVHFAGPLAGRGVVSIRHTDGLRTTYEPVIAAVGVGAAVRAGDPIGVVAAAHAGCPVVTCLHWGARRGDLYLDPLALLGLARVRLLPWAG